MLGLIVVWLVFAVFVYRTASKLWDFDDIDAPGPGGQIDGKGQKR